MPVILGPQQTLLPLLQPLSLKGYQQAILQPLQSQHQKRCLTHQLQLVRVQASLSSLARYTCQQSSRTIFCRWLFSARSLGVAACHYNVL